jgi:Raf kinase inhibitor-like YbhB/YbcL family protein
MPFRISSPAFMDGGRIPRRYTCDGDNVAPPLEWSGAPDGSKSVAITCEDPDAPSGAFTHWVVYDIPVGKHRLWEGSSLGQAGVNDFGNTGFGGPCPPKQDRAHHYHFRVYALDARHRAGSATGYVTRDAFLRGIEGHVLAEGELTAVYAAR